MYLKGIAYLQIFFQKKKLGFTFSFDYLWIKDFKLPWLHD